MYNDSSMPATIGQVIKAFMSNGGFTKVSLIIQAGNILLESKGRNIAAEFFLRGFLTADPDEPRNFLSLAVADVQGDVEKAGRIKEIREDCYAFLLVCRRSLQFENQMILDEIKKDPPHADFLLNVEEKIRASKMLEELAAVA